MSWEWGLLVLLVGSGVYYGVVLYTLSVVEVARSAAEHHFTW